MKKVTLLINFFLLATFALHAQQNNISGTVKANENTVIAGATVQVLNTNLVTKTDEEGYFEIKNMRQGKISLMVSAMGFATEIKVLAGGDKIHITLKNKNNALDDVTVSAQKRDERLLEIPIAITAFSASKVNDFRIQNLKDLATVVPNLYSSNPGDGRNVTSIRGIGTTSYDPAVATYIDGVNQFGLDTYIASLFDIERIEVLRGPQGTLYGRNAMGGVINIITKQPGNTTTGFAGVDIGNFGQQRYSAGIRTALVKNKLFFGAAGLFNKQDGFYSNEFNNSSFDKLNGYLGNYYLKFLATANFALTLNVKHNENRNNGTFPLAGSVEEALINPFKLNQNSVAEMADNLFNASLSGNYSGNDFNFTFQTAYQSNYRYYKQPIDGDFSPLDMVSIVNNYGNDWNKVQVFTQEIKFSSPANRLSKLKWLVGLYSFYQKNPVKQGTYFGANGDLYGAVPNTTAVNVNNGKGLGWAAFGQISYAIADRLEATAGLRYDYEHKKVSASGEYLIPGYEPIITQADTIGKANFNALSPKISLAYKLADENSVYASYSRGYRAGGITQLASDPTAKPLDAYKPEYSNNFEIGSKNTFLNQRLSVNFAAFYVNITDAQVPVLILPDALTSTRNAGKLSSKGLEFELAAIPVKGLSVDYNFGYTHAKYKTSSTDNGSETIGLNGKRQIYTPETTSMLALQYSHKVDQSSGLNALARGEWLFTGNQFFDLSNQIQQKGFNVYNAKIGLTQKRFDLFLWGRNLANKTYIDYAYDFGAAHLGNPKTYGVSLTGKF
ncbi:TonB-dependent receptor [Pedobacter sp. BMA]|uniref:TonB-dependent receptor n=1 Tax=Pedobacter sp. BMA TaxID=1663685 RepID=UPI0006492D88|nr:TonB-dependent receptor [Pedobacter sp. BMA]KLT66026.1 hypothetical protein AB669_07580 [Pedobacter sp. BMA]